MRGSRIVVGLFVILLFLVPGFVSAEEETRGGENFIPVHLQLKEGSQLSPKEPMVTDFDLEKSLPNGTEDTGIDGFGILPTGELDWKPIGVWKTDPLKSDLTIKEEIEYIFWFSWKKEGEETEIDIKASLMINDEIISGSEIEKWGNTINNTPQKFSFKISMDADAFLESGDVLGINIQTRVNGEYGKLHFNGVNFKSGVILDCNPLQIHNMDYNSEDRTIVVEMTDSFGMSPFLLNPQLTIDGVLYKEDFDIGLNSENMAWQLFFPIYIISIEEGDHYAVITFSYTLNSTIQISEDLNFDYEHISTRRESDSPFLGIIGIISVIGLALWSRKRFNP